MIARPSFSSGSAASGYAWAIVSTAVALLVSHLSWPLFQPVPFILFFPAIMFTAWRGGPGPGLLATVLAAVLAHYYLMEPRFGWSFKGLSDLLRFGVFVGVGVVITMLTASLRRTRTRVIETLENLFEGFVLSDPDFRYLYVNRMAAQLMGKQPGELVGRTWFEVFPEAADSESVRIARQVLADGVTRSHDAYDPPRDRWFGSTCYRAAEGFSVFFRDITERRRAEENLRVSEAEFRAMFEHSGAGIAQVDVESGRFVRVNPPMTQITGYAEDELLARTFHEITHPDDRARAAAAVEQLARGQSTRQVIEKRYLRKDGDVAHAQITLTPLQLRDGARRVLAVVRDVSERRQAAARLQSLEDRFHLMADHAPVKVWVCSPDKLRTWFNRRWLVFTGRTMAQELGKGWIQGLHPDDRERVVRDGDEAIDARRSFQREFRLRRHDGDFRWIIEHGVPLWSSDQEFLGYIGSSLDIHDRKLAEQEREQLLDDERAMRADAERTSRLKDEFLATLSHELRTPLQAILGWARILSAGEGAADKVRQAVETIERNAAIQTQLIEDLLDMSRIISGKVRLDVQQIELPQVIEAALRTVEPAAEAKNIELRRVLDPLAGPVRGDPHRIQQVVWNLVSNAIKFTPRDGKVEVVLERVNSHIEVTVSDTGQGIDPEFLPHVFDRFRQADASSTRKWGGLGLGLAIARHLAELHGGTITARSPGAMRGSTFTLVLPVMAAHVAASDGEERRHPRGGFETPAGETVQLDGVRVLVVDDDADARDLIWYILAGSGATVTTAGSAAEALDRLPGFKPDVMVSDIGMPQRDGYDLIHQVRALPADRGGNTPAIALTAFARSEDRTRALMTGYQLHIAKPVEPVELAAAVASLARRSPRSGTMKNR
jgi:PAS domain S-box-containing protein